MRAPGRGWAYLGALLGGAVSIAANVAHSYVPPAEIAKAIETARRVGIKAPEWSPPFGAVVGAVFWPIALFVAIEILARVPWPAGNRWVAVRYLGLLPVAAVAAVVSYRHLSGLLDFYGEDSLTVVIGPLAVDGLMVMATGALIATSRQRTTEPVEVVTPDPSPADVTAEAVDQDVAALCSEILNQARRARLEVSRSLIWRPAPRMLPPLVEPVAQQWARSVVIEQAAAPDEESSKAPGTTQYIEPTTVAAVDVDQEPTESTPAAAPKSTQRRRAKRQSAADRVAKAAARTPAATPAQLAARLSLSERTVQRHLPRPADDTTTTAERPSGPVNGHAVDLVTTD